MSAELVVVFIGVAAIIKLIEHRYSEIAKIKRTLREASRWPIAELPENTQGRVVGRARAVGAALTAPLSGRACVHYFIEVLDNSGSSQRHLFTEGRGVAFVIEDDTGRALVEQDGAQLTLKVDHHTMSDQDDPPTPDEYALLVRHHQQHRLAACLSYREAVITIGERVAVLGSGIREPDPEAIPTADYRGALPTRLRLTGSPRYPLLISDLPETVDD